MEYEEKLRILNPALSGTEFTSYMTNLLPSIIGSVVTTTVLVLAGFGLTSAFADIQHSAHNSILIPHSDQLPPVKDTEALIPFNTGADISPPTPAVTWRPHREHPHWLGNGRLSPALVATFNANTTMSNVAEGTTTVAIPDPSLRAALEHALGKVPREPITKAELATLTRLWGRPREEKITDLSGLEFATSLTSLFLESNAISDLTPLASLIGLTRLDLYNNSIQDLTPLAGLTSLTELRIWNNSISDLGPLANLTGLGLLRISSNSISDLMPLANLANMRYLSLTNNSISDLGPLAGLPRLANLELGQNSISDITPLANLAGLTNLSLWSNQISDLTSLANLTGLTNLSLGNNSISDLAPLAGLIRLENLQLVDNSISDLTPLTNVTGLMNLDLGHNSISDLTPLAGLPRLAELRLSRNSISDLTPLADLIRLERLWLSNNSISDLTPLADLINLAVLVLSDNSISDLKPLLANMGLGRGYGDIIDVRHNPLSAESVNAHIPTLLSRHLVKVYLDDVHEDTPETATDLGLDDSVSGEISPNWDADYFRLNIGETTEVGFFITITGTSSNTSLVATLYDAANTVLSSNEIKYGTRLHIKHQLVPGIYYIAIRSRSGGDHGAYTIVAEGNAITPIPDQQLGADNDTVRLHLAPYFTALGETLSYTVTSSNPALATAHVEAGVLIVKSNQSQEEGAVTITITATDSDGLSISSTITVTIGTVTRGLLQGWRLPWLMELLRNE